MRKAFALTVIPALALGALLAATPIAAESLLDRARDAVRDAGKKIEDAANDAGRSVRDFLTDHPDLNRDIVDFGERIGVPGFAGAKPEPGPGIQLSIAEGMPGAEVTLRAGGLPGGVKVRVSLVMPPAEDRPLAEATTSDRGDLIVTVRVPDGLAAGDRVAFSLDTVDGKVRLVSREFRVVSADRAVSVTGTLSKEGVECPALRGDDGKLYTLIPGELGGFGPGDRVHVEGTAAEVSTCMQGTTIVVSAISAAK